MSSKPITKTCTTCGEDKSTLEFYKNKGGKYGVASVCAPCARIKAAEYYKDNRQKAIQATVRSRERRLASGDDRSDEINTTKHRQRRRKREAIVYKGGACVDCGGVFHQAAFDFHHVDPSTKLYNVATRLGRGASIELCKEELDKCVLLCSNCHRVRHYNES